jgi:hypothetical protein
VPSDLREGTVEIIHLAHGEEDDLGAEDDDAGGLLADRYGLDRAKVLEGLDAPAEVAAPDLHLAVALGEPFREGDEAADGRVGGDANHRLVVHSIAAHYALELHGPARHCCRHANVARYKGKLLPSCPRYLYEQ